MKLVKTASNGQRLQLSYADWKRIGRRTGWTVEAIGRKTTRPELDVEEEARKALEPLQRQLESFKGADMSWMDPRRVAFLLESGLEKVLLAMDDSLSVYEDGKIVGDVKGAMLKFLTTPPQTSSGPVAKLKSVARQIAQMAGAMPQFDPMPMVPRTIRKLKKLLSFIQKSPLPIPQRKVMDRILERLTPTFPKKLYHPGPAVPDEQVRDILQSYLNSPPDSHPREREVQELVLDILKEAFRKSSCAAVALLKYASGAIKISRSQWLAIGSSQGWIKKLAKEERPFKIAVDFDGTIAEHAEFPEIGEPVPDAFTWLKKFKKWGDLVILHTMRSGEELEQAIEYCREHGIEFDGINEDPDQSEWTDSPKAYANVYVDDLAAGCPLLEEGRDRPCVDWSKVGPMVARMRKPN